MELLFENSSRLLDFSIFVKGSTLEVFIIDFEVLVRDLKKYDQDFLSLKILMRPKELNYDLCFCNLLSEN